MNRKAVKMKSVSREYPRTVSYNGTKVELSLVSAADTQAIKAFVATLPEHDLLFLSRDITHPKVIQAWIDAIPEGRIKSIVARQNGVVVGCTAIALQELSWSRHVGELRVLVSPALRGKGLGRLLIQECFIQALELGLSKLCVRMTVDQQAAITGFEGIGFRTEALFRNHVKDREGKLHDLAVLSHDVDEVQSWQEVYGIADALGA